MSNGTLMPRERQAIALYIETPSAIEEMVTGMFRAILNSGKHLVAAVGESANGMPLTVVIAVGKEQSEQLTKLIEANIKET